MKQRAFVVYEYLSSEEVWIKSSINYCVGGTQLEFLAQLAHKINFYKGRYRIKSIKFFESRV